MCSTNEPKTRSFSSATVNAGSITIRAACASTLSLRWVVIRRPRRGLPGAPSCRSSLEPGVRDALDDLALEEQERDQQRQRAEDGERHDLRVLRAVEGVHRRQADRDGLQRPGRGDHERPYEVV